MLQIFWTLKFEGFESIQYRSYLIDITDLCVIFRTIAQIVRKLGLPHVLLKKTSKSHKIANRVSIVM